MNAVKNRYSTNRQPSNAARKGSERYYSETQLASVEQEKKNKL